MKFFKKLFNLNNIITVIMGVFIITLFLILFGCSVDDDYYEDDDWEDVEEIELEEDDNEDFMEDDD
jgi:hypothetical protein